MPQYMSNDKFRLVPPWRKRAALALFGHGNAPELVEGGATQASRIAAGEVATYLAYRGDQAAKVNPRVYASTGMPISTR